jgi:predicted transcriptional regulator
MRQLMKTLTVKLPTALDRRLARAARRREAAKSDLVRRALVRYLGEDEPADGSFAEQAADLAGSLAGAADLSTSPRHLRGYGR